MLSQVIIGSVCDAPQLAPAEREQELKVRSRLAVEAQLLRRMIAGTHLVILHAEGLQPIDAVLLPVSEPLQVSTRLAEELQLHLLELPGTEGEVTRCNLVTEGLTNLSDTKRDLLSGGSLYVLEVYKDTLRSLRTEVYGILRILGNTLEGLEHQVELTDIGEIMLSAGRTADIVLIHISLHFFRGPCVYRALDLNAVLSHIVLDELIGTETLLTALAVHQRVGEAAQMSGRYPGLRVHQDGTVYTHVVRILLYEFLPPCALYIVLKLYAQIAVIPGVGQTAVNLRARIYKASCLCQRYNFVHCLFHLLFSSSLTYK